MQTPLTHHPFSPELFTRERRRTRLQRFLNSFERQHWADVTPVVDLVPLKVTASQAKIHDWSERAVR
jgi:hypothetical protein